MLPKRYLAIVAVVLLTGSAASLLFSDSLRERIWSDVAIAVRLAGTSEYVHDYRLPIEKLYQRYELAPPQSVKCKASRSICDTVYFILSGPDRGPLGATDLDTAITSVSAWPHLWRKDEGLIPLLMPNAGPEGPLKSYYLGVVNPAEPVGFDNLVRFSCSPNLHHCIVDVGEWQFLGQEKYHLSFSFDEGRISEWRTILDLLTRCIREKCKLP